MRARRTPFAVIAFVLVACGGRTHDEPTGDTGVLAFDAELPDVDGAVCTGRCASGATCRRDAATTCACVSGSFLCRACSEAASSSGCPSERPCAGARCSAPTSAECAYSSGCGSVDTATCVAGRWLLTLAPCREDCPRAEVVPGDSCAGPDECRVATTCGTSGYAWCVGGVASSLRECAATMICSPDDVAGTPCTIDHAECFARNDCGGRDRRVCTGGVWTADATACCPAEAAAAGDTCTHPSTVGCEWASTTCYCAADSRFRCVSGPVACVEGLSCTAGFACRGSGSKVCVCVGGELKCRLTSPPL